MPWNCAFRGFQKLGAACCFALSKSRQVSGSDPNGSSSPGSSEKKGEKASEEVFFLYLF